MAHFFSSFSNSLARGLLFSQITRHINPELLSAGIFMFALFGSPWLDEGIAEDISNGIIIEFVMIHANVGIGGARMLATSEKSKRKLVLMTGIFYFMFVAGLALGIGAWWMMFCFLFLTWSRLQEPFQSIQKSTILNEVVVTMARFILYMVTGLVCAGIGTLMDVDDYFKMLAWGTCYFLLLFVGRKKFKLLHELNLFGKTSIQRDIGGRAGNMINGDN